MVGTMHAAAAAAKLLQLCPTLCNPIDGSPPGSPVPGILQARTLEWVAISFSNPWKWKVKVKLLSCVRLLVTPWTAAHQAPPSMGFSVYKVIKINITGGKRHIDIMQPQIGCAERRTLFLSHSCHKGIAIIESGETANRPKRSLAGYRLWGCQELGTTENTQH